MEDVMEIELVRVPGGTFNMGSSNSEGYASEKPQHEVTVAGFYIGKYQITQEQWQQVMENNPSHFKGGKNLPVETVSWNDAKEFCKKLSRMAGREYRLPTEAEWEYACRAGTTGYYAGDLDDIEWYDKNSRSKTHPVGQKQPNAYGLHDMHGNVWEWCRDWYGAYEAGPDRDPVGPPTGEYRVLRGGSWINYGHACRSAVRCGLLPVTRFSHLGFRVVAGARTPINNEGLEMKIEDKRGPKTSIKYGAFARGTVITLDGNLHYICTENGLVNLRTGALTHYTQKELVKGYEIRKATLVLE